jgi:hypothetical protein
MEEAALHLEVRLVTVMDLRTEVEEELKAGVGTKDKH